MKHAARWVFAVVTCVAYALALGQTDARRVAGVINDALGRPLAQAHVSLKAAHGKVVREARAGPDGRFSFDSVPLGTYAVLAERSGFRQSTSIVTVGTSTPPEVVMTMASEKAVDVVVVSARLDRARNELSPRTGSSQYIFDLGDIQALPEGESTSFNQVLLQAPGVANDQFGQLHIRGDHANVQYRINNVILPEGITGFGQALDTRFAKRIDLLTGALPAQYGYRTAGVIDIETKTGFERGGRIGLYAGSHDTVNPSIELSGATEGGLNYYLSGSLLQNKIGIENPEGTRDPLHDKTTQEKGFGYFSYLLNSTTRASVIVGSSVGKFQIPDLSKPSDALLASAVDPTFPTTAVNENQRELNQYAIAALQGSLQNGLDYQFALFSRYSSVTFNPDPVGDLALTGVASQVFRSSFTNGLKADR